MAADPLDKLRLTLMQDVLPVGVAVVERVRKGGLKGVVSSLSRSDSGADPLTQLRDEGEPLASQLRDGLDRLSPGLGNPVMKVDVRVEQPDGPDSTADVVAGQADQSALVQRLQAIDARLNQLEQVLERQ